LSLHIRFTRGREVAPYRDLAEIVESFSAAAIGESPHENYAPEGLHDF
jgi:hypothetical protein